MKLHLDSGDGLLRISAYDGTSVTVSEQRLTTTFALTPQNLFDALAPASLDALSWRELRTLHGAGIEILVLGTGARQRFPAQTFYAELAAERIGLEVMDNGAACRTYNILAAEGRRVAALILLGE